MKHFNYKEMEPEIVDIEGIKDVNIRRLITEEDGAQNFAMRLFEVKPGGHTPWHQHEWEHEMFIVEGEGIAKKENGEIKFKPGDVFFIEPWEWHNFTNSGKETLKFLCLIPRIEKDK
jgi:quercetin dioxygenase-like cupin family protein